MFGENIRHVKVIKFVPMNRNVFLCEMSKNVLTALFIPIHENLPMGLLGILAAFFSQECETSQPRNQVNW